MKWLFKWVLRLALIVVALIVLLLIFKDTILRVVIENRIRARTGMDVKIGRYSSGVFSPVMTIENLQLYNTAEFGGTPFVNIPEIHLEFDAAAFTHREVHVKLARINLAELDVVRNQAGQTNLFSILDGIHRRARKKHGGAFDFQFTGIDVLNVTLGKGRLIDLKDPLNNCETAVNLRDQVFEDVKTQEKLTSVLLVLYLRSGGEFCFISRDTLTNVLLGKAMKKLHLPSTSPVTSSGPAPPPAIP